METFEFFRTKREKIRIAVGKPYGMTAGDRSDGSGKTTTLYTLLKTLKYRTSFGYYYRGSGGDAIDGVQQMKEFANRFDVRQWRLILRQDPNIIMVARSRLETAGIAVNAALTGHLVLSTAYQRRGNCFAAAFGYEDRKLFDRVDGQCYHRPALGAQDLFKLQV